MCRQRCCCGCYFFCVAGFVLVVALANVGVVFAVGAAIVVAVAADASISYGSRHI